MIDVFTMPAESQCTDWPTIGRLWLVALSLTLCSCEARIDPRAQFDRQVENQFLIDFQQQSAIQFFRSGGHFCDTAQESIDRDRVLPLLEEIEERYQLQPVVLLDEKSPQKALALLVPLSPAVSGETLEDFLVERQKDFPAEILLAPGHRWLSLDFLTRSEREELDRVQPGGRSEMAE